MGVKAQKWVVKQVPTGLPKLEDFECITEEVPDCNDGEFIIEAEWVSVDPYMRYMIRFTAPGDVVVGTQVARVIESKNPSYPVGCRLVASVGWRSHTLLTAAEMTHKPGSLFRHQKLSAELGEHQNSIALGVLGMPGYTAYFGMLEVCRPKSGDVVVVNCAGGAVGSAACQIAKIKGCKVIAFAGTAAKVAWLEAAGVDCAVNYKTESIADALKTHAPEGVNCYFDNVGGAFTSEVMMHMAQFGRVAICGAISTYNDDTKTPSAPTMTSPYSEQTILWKQLVVEGFIVVRWEKRYDEATQQLRRWLDEGLLKYTETISEGFASIPAAFLGLFSGDNIGKAVVKI